MTMTAAEFVALLEQHAPRLRDAGVLSIQVDGAGATFAPAPPPKVDLQAAAQPATSDPLDDPALYQGGAVPGYELEGEG
jgi:hypothetical protein